MCPEGYFADSTNADAELLHNRKIVEPIRKNNISVLIIRDEHSDDIIQAVPPAMTNQEKPRYTIIHTMKLYQELIITSSILLVKGGLQRSI